MGHKFILVQLRYAINPVENSFSMRVALGCRSADDERVD